MPCQDDRDYDYRPLRLELDKVTRMLCEVLSGKMTNETIDWHRAHKAEDAKRQAREDALLLRKFPKEEPHG